MDKITIKVDPDLADLIPSYIENRLKDIEAINEGLLKSDFESIRILGHSMKGSGGGYGFDEISRIGSEIEGTAIENNGNRIKELVGELKTYLGRLDIQY